MSSAIFDYNNSYMFFYKNNSADLKCKSNALVARYPIETYISNMNHWDNYSSDVFGDLSKTLCRFIKYFDNYEKQKLQKMHFPIWQEVSQKKMKEQTTFDSIS